MRKKMGNSAAPKAGEPSSIKSKGIEILVKPFGLGKLCGRILRADQAGFAKERPWIDCGDSPELDRMLIAFRIQHVPRNH